MNNNLNNNNLSSSIGTNGYSFKTIITNIKSVLKNVRLIKPGEFFSEKHRIIRQLKPNFILLQFQLHAD